MAYIRGGEVPRNATVNSVTELLLAKFRPNAFSKMSLGAQLYLTRALARNLADRWTSPIPDRAVISARVSLRDGMKIEWDVPVEMDDGLVLRADVFRSAAEGRYPVILSYGPTARGSRSRGLQDRLGTHGARLSGRGRRRTNQYANWEWSIRKSGCRTATPACASIRAAPGARPLPVPQQRARDARHPPVHRMGGSASLVERKSRHERHFLLREQPVARGRVAAAAPRGDLRVEGWNDAYRESARHGASSAASARTGRTCR